MTINRFSRANCRRPPWSTLYLRFPRGKPLYLPWISLLSPSRAAHFCHLPSPVFPSCHRRRVTGKARCFFFSFFFLFFSFSCRGASATAQRSLLVISVLITPDANDACIARQKLRQPSVRVASRRDVSLVLSLLSSSILRFPRPWSPFCPRNARPQRTDRTFRR